MANVLKAGAGGRSFNRAFVRKHPVATKRVVRAILKASTICALEPERVGRLLVEKGYAAHYDYAVQILKELPYGRWREYNPEETVRFYALRLHEVGFIKSTPQKIITQGTDWRFVDELKKKLKGYRRTLRHGRLTSAQTSRMC